MAGNNYVWHPTLTNYCAITCQHTHDANDDSCLFRANLPRDVENFISRDISIDKGSGHKRRHVPVAEEGICLPLVDSRTPVNWDRKMSALQTFMLVVDHDKQEAKQIAERIAHGELP